MRDVRQDAPRILMMAATALLLQSCVSTAVRCDAHLSPINTRLERPAPVAKNAPERR